MVAHLDPPVEHASDRGAGTETVRLPCRSSWRRSRSAILTRLAGHVSSASSSSSISAYAASFDATKLRRFVDQPGGRVPADASCSAAGWSADTSNGAPPSESSAPSRGRLASRSGRSPGTRPGPRRAPDVRPGARRKRRRRGPRGAAGLPTLSGGLGERLDHLRIDRNRERCEQLVRGRDRPGPASVRSHCARVTTGAVGVRGVVQAEAAATSGRWRCSSSQRCASSAAIVPEPAAVTAWR